MSAFYVLLALNAFYVFITLLPLWRFEAWWVRSLDFPRIQFFLFGNSFSNIGIAHTRLVISHNVGPVNPIPFLPYFSYVVDCPLHTLLSGRSKERSQKGTPRIV